MHVDTNNQQAYITQQAPHVPWYKKHKVAIGVVVVLLALAPLVDNILYRIDSFLYGMFFRDGMLYQPDLSGDPVHYESSLHGIAFDYWPGFSLDDTMSPDGAVTPIAQLSASIYTKTPNNQFPEGIMFISVSVPGEQVITSAMVAAEKKEEYAKYDYVTLLQNGFYDLPNSRTDYLEYNVSDSHTGTRTTKEYFLVHDGKLYIVTFTDAEEEYPESVKYSDDFVQSIVFL